MLPRTALAASIALLAVAGVLGLMAWSIFNPGPRTTGGGITKTGTAAPDFTLDVLGSEDQLTMSEYRGTPVVLNVWASWCPPCRVELPLLEKGWSQYRDAGVQFIGLDIQDTESAAMDTIDRFNLTYPNVRDATGETSTRYGVVGLPTTYFIDADGVIVRRAVGALTPELLAVSVEELLAGETPSDADVVNPDGYYNFDGSQP